MKIIEIIMLSFVFGTLSNQIGGLIGIIDKSNRKNVSKTIAFTAGITTSIICFELLKESFDIANKYLVVLFTLIGVVIIKMMDMVITGKKEQNKNNSSAVIVSAMAAHNITEGMAIGVGFKVSAVLGISLLFAIMMHNIPEGMIIGSILGKENKSIRSMLNICGIIGVFLAAGTALGVIMGILDDKYIMPNLALSAGAMLYVLACELIPEMYDEKHGKNGIIYIIGFLIGSLICKL